MLLRTLLDGLPTAGVRGRTDVEISNLAYDSRDVAANSLFIAVPAVGAGPQSGGFHFIEEAINRGAAAVVTQSDVPPVASTTVQVPDARLALADLAAAFFGHPSRRLHAFAVTGTDGKTTTSYLLDAIFRFVGYETGLIGTIETRIGNQRILNANRMTTPESLDLQRTFRAMVEAGVTHVALEASSHALALERLRACHFEACALTNVTGDHVEFHGSWDAYVEAKSRLFCEVGYDAPAVLNRDDQSFQLFAARAVGRVLAYSCIGRADLMAQNIARTATGSDFDLVRANQRARVTLQLPGAFNVSNALAAAGMALLAGIEIREIAAGLATAQPPPGRMERISGRQPFDVIVDYGHTPQAFRSVLATLRDMCGGRLIAVFGATGNRDRQKRPVLAQIAREFADFSIITNEDPFGEEVEAIMADVAAGMPAAEEGTRFIREPDRARAIDVAVAQARPGDTVVILGKGHETSIVAHGKKQSWSDADTVRAAVESRF